MPAEKPSESETTLSSAHSLARTQTLATLGQLGAGVTHEVRNSMTAILGFAQIANRSAGISAPTRRLIEMIEKECLRCLDLLSSYLSISRTPVRRSIPTAVNEIVDRVSRLVRQQFQDRRVALRLELAAGLPHVLGDPDALQQVILNLALNALHATSVGHVVLRTTCAGSTVTIDVQDTGEGIPDHLRERIFEPFFSTRPDSGGTGLGLWISRDIVNEHDGTLTVDSAPGKGSRFTVSLPATPTEEKAR